MFYSFFVCALKCFVLDVSDCFYDPHIFKKYFTLLKFEDFLPALLRLFLSL